MLFQLIPNNEKIQFTFFSNFPFNRKMFEFLFFLFHHFKKRSDKWLEWVVSFKCAFLKNFLNKRKKSPKFLFTYSNTFENILNGEENARLFSTFFFFYKIITVNFFFYVEWILLGLSNQQNYRWKIKKIKIFSSGSLFLSGQRLFRFHLNPRYILIRVFGVFQILVFF